MTIEREGHDEAVYFVGPEVETTPACGMKTLFVVGVRSVAQMIEKATENDCKHIYLGANRSFQKNKLWGDIVPELIDAGFKVTLDYPISSADFVVELFDETKIANHPDFIPMISAIVPKVETFSKNLTIKIDDVGFEDTNTGVWCLPIRELLDSNRYTPWSEYVNDHVVMTDSDIKALRNKSRRGKKDD